MSADDEVAGLERQKLERSLGTITALNREIATWMESTVIPLVAAHSPPSELERTLRGTLIRSVGWNKTVGKCLLEDFQAVVVSARASFELLADVLELVKHPERIQVMLDWEQSAKLKACESKGKSGSGATLHAAEVPEPYRTFMAQNADRIHRTRIVHWPTRDDPAKGRHPDRWYDRSFRDILKLHSGEIADEFVLFEVLESHMNWTTHGTSLVSARGLTIEAFAASSLLSAFTTARILTTIAWLLIDRLDAAIFSSSKERLVGFRAALGLTIDASIDLE